MYVFTLFSFFLLLSSLIKRKKQLYILLGISFILFILLGFRSYSVGTDTRVYKEYFEIVRSNTLLTVEIGWVYLNKVVIIFGGDFNIFLILTAALTIFPITILLYKYSVNPLFSLFFYYTLYLYFYSFNISRQSLALSIVLLAYVFLLNSKKIWFLGLIIIAALFHTTALLILPLFFVDKIPNKNFLYYIVLIFSALIGLLFPHVLQTYLFKIGNYNSYLETIGLNNLVGTSIYLMILDSFFIFILKTIKIKDIYFKIFFIFIVFSNILIRLPFSERLLLYLSIFLIIFFPYYISKVKYKEKLFFRFILILYAYFIFFRNFGAGEIIPYSNRLLPFFIID